MKNCKKKLFAFLKDSVSFCVPFISFINSYLSYYLTDMEFKDLVDSCGESSRSQNPILNTLDMFTKDKSGVRVCLYYHIYINLRDY